MEDRSKGFAGEEELDEGAEDTLEGKYLTFRLADEEYGIAIRYVTEIIGVQRVTEVPDLPDMRSRFQLPAKEYDERTCFVVVEIEDYTVGLVVDEVNEVATIAADQIEPPPRRARKGAGYICGLGKVGEEVKILLDLKALAFTEDLVSLAELGVTGEAPE
jgi:purine-binding chemotaxis protein CheW